MRNEATEAQVLAARPDWSTWLSANAGSGKTRVLTDRVARLLLQNVQPQHILCLTYTKAAASEMQNRLFKRLGQWAMLPDEKLRQQLSDLGLEGHVEDTELRNARTLFARAIEAPGGLKIQTIHSFCSGLLRRFPLEAKVSPQFKEMEDRAAALLREEVLREIAESADKGCVDALAAQITANDFDKLTREIVMRRAEFSRFLTHSESLSMFGLPETYDENELHSEVFLGNEEPLIQSLVVALAKGSTNDVKNAAKLASIEMLGLHSLPLLESIFLTGPKAKSPFSAKIGAVPTKDTAKTIPDLLPHLEALMLRVEAARPKRLALTAARKTSVLHDFARVFLPAYERKKQARSWLDFDDLILRARDLLTDPAVAAWVLYRLDGGIDHILVDEAQDTSPAQWRVIELLAQEFTSGEGARSGKARTIFVVGDKKQSIYSFQGADPREFDRMQREFAEKLNQTERPLVQRELQFSFRSSQAILGLVDETFRDHEASGFPNGGRHRAFKVQMPGRVDIWPVLEPIDSKEDDHWFEPVDRLGEKHHSIRLAEKIADTIRDLIDQKHPIPEEIGHSGTYRMRPVRPGDFLILVRRRSDLFAEIIRACKDRKLAIAGADRLKVGAELAVKDLAALLSFLSTSEDSFSLAVALKSPLFGWSEKQLFRLAHGRKDSYLWEEMRKRAEDFPQEMAILNDLRDNTDFLRPYDLIERILTLHNGRKKLLSRLGIEAEDGINAFLAQALAYERSSIPSLKGFLEWMVTDDLEIKRQMDSAEDQIRVMTVHGAKGLESPIVIMPETLRRRPPNDGNLKVANGIAVWNSSSTEAPDLLEQIKESESALETAESDRLLYVAMTRAEKWLILAGAGDWKEGDASWYDKVRASAMRMGAEPAPMPTGEHGLRLLHGEWEGPVSDDLRPTLEPPAQLSSVFTSPVDAPQKPKSTLSPSDLGGAKALSGEAGLDEESAMQRGTWLHGLLEHLPAADPADWPHMARIICEDSPDTPELLAEASGVLSNPKLAFLFDHDSLPEVPLSADLSTLGQRIHGVVDRLILSPQRVLAVDFKSNSVVPDRPEHVPDGLLRQMGAYAEALSQIYPGRSIETAILWTRTAQLMPLPQELVAAALGSVRLS